MPWKNPGHFVYRTDFFRYTQGWIKGQANRAAALYANL